MKSLGLWLLLAAILVVIATEADAGTTKTKVKVKVKFTRTTKKRNGRSIEDTVTLPCDVREYDINEDGMISRYEWEAYMSEFNPVLNSDTYVNLLTQQLDTNGDGVLQIDEFSLDTEYKKDCLQNNEIAAENSVYVCCSTMPMFASLSLPRMP
ncbi:uncharacterized protein LOC132558386 [Ylistrum balloti]|uniref:uncharacterized protein LOC132558386 n=1 Tax=Ylistrum balloti TaxID=509963 RepID=UPI0029059481|nr:uncharacterized protein LOC132558386 [Ylistrum balloti]